MILRAQGLMVSERGKRRWAHADNPAEEYHSSTWFEIDENGVPMVEWRFVARLLDRIFFVCYIICMSISLALVFPR